MEEQAEGELEVQAAELQKAQAEREQQITETVKRIEDAVLQFLTDSYTQSKSAMEDRLALWRSDEQRFHAEAATLKQNGEWFENHNPPKAARLIDIHKARMFTSIFPDTHRLDFFRLTPDSEQPEGTMPNEQDAEYARMAEIALRNDLINGKFIQQADDCLTDKFIFGNAYLLSVWELDIQFRYEWVDNPEYNPQLPPEQNVKLDIVDGVEVPTPIQPKIRQRRPIRQFDAPKARYIRATNVIPTELDRNGIADCTGVFIYDTCRANDLRENEIASGGYIYANLDEVKVSHEKTDVPETPDGITSIPTKDKTHQSKPSIARKMDRITYFGRFRLDEIIEDLNLEEYMEGEDGKEVMARLTAKYNWDSEKLSNWNTWHVQMVDDQRVLVCWQPLPYETDAIPLKQDTLFRMTGNTLGGSIYDRVREEEQTRNRMNQLRLKHTQKTVEPPVMVIRDYIEARWWNAMGGTLKYKPNMIIPGLKGASIQQTIQPMEFSQAPIQVAESAISSLDNQMDQSSHLPAVQQGLPSGGQTATEISKMGAASDVMSDYFNKRTEFSFFTEVLDDMLLLHHQYTEQPKLVRYYDEAGELAFMQVPPEVWSRRYKVHLIGWESIGNREVRAMNFNEFMKTAQAMGYANPEAMLAEQGRILQVRDPKRLIKAPEPQPPQPTVSVSRSLALQHERLPATVVAKLMQSGGGTIELTPEEIQQMQEMERALATREVADQANVPIPLEDALPPGWAPQHVGASNPVQPGQPAAGPNAEAFRDHHAPGEIENRQRGLHDEVGLQNSMGKMNASPLNARMANGGAPA